MTITNKDIDKGQPFDWGRTSAEYAKFRDIYPDEYYNKIISLGLCTSGQKVLDLGTGTGVLPRNLYKHGATFTGADISENQIEFGRNLSKESEEHFYVEDAIGFDVNVRFTRESWHGRMKACRGIGASSLSEEMIDAWESEHIAYMNTLPPEFDIIHYVSILNLHKK